MNEESAPQSHETTIAISITLGIIVLGGFGVWYFFAPPPDLSLQEAAELRAQEKAAIAEAETQAFQEAAKTMECGTGISGTLCRLGRGACDTALGGYFCYTEGRDTGE